MTTASNGGYLHYLYWLVLILVDDN